LSLVIYNTLSRTKEPFEPIHPGKVGIYLCGPTVYKPSHLGHAVGPIIFDAIKRYLTYRGYEVTWVVNITDVDDKLIDEAAKQETTVAALAQRITRDYLDAMAKLHVDGMDIMPKASEHIDTICNLILALIEKEKAYVRNGDVYFDVTACADYGKLSNRSIEDQQGQRGLENTQKRNPGDFALWKAAKPNEPDEVKFDSPWGKGRPGWHIECSAMAQRYLGDTFDIHGGGMDLVFPHHENEIAQSECATGKPFAKVWMHNGLTRFNTKKVSKSDTDPQATAALSRMTLHNLLEEFDPEHIRFLILSTHYRSPIDFSDEELEAKRKGLNTFYRLFERVERVCAQSPYAVANENVWHRIEAGGGQADDNLDAACRRCVDSFEQAMDEDFNTAGGIAALFEMASTINRYIDDHKIESPVIPGQSLPPVEAEAGTHSPVIPTQAGTHSPAFPPLATEDEKLDVAKKNALSATGRLIAVARLIGLFLDPPASSTGVSDELLNQVMQVLIDIRRHTRKNKDFTTADLIRQRLAEVGITLEDRPDATVWRIE